MLTKGLALIAPVFAVSELSFKKIIYDFMNYTGYDGRNFDQTENFIIILICTEFFNLEEQKAVFGHNILLKANITIDSCKRFYI